MRIDKLVAYCQTMDKTTNTPQRRDLGINSLMIPLPQSSKYSDFQLECDGLSFPVHKIIVCSRSPVIGAAVDRGFKVMTLL